MIDAAETQRGRVLQTVGGAYTVEVAGAPRECSLRGRIKLDKSIGRVAVGDVVEVEELEDGSCVICGVLPRSNKISRKRTGSHSLRVNLYGGPEETHLAYLGVPRPYLDGAITGDAEWKGGKYAEGAGPSAGLALARMIGHITYLSEASMHRKFGRRFVNGNGRSYGLARDFQVEQYLHSQGDRFVRRFDAFQNFIMFVNRLFGPAGKYNSSQPDNLKMGVYRGHHIFQHAVASSALALWF